MLLFPELQSSLEKLLLTVFKDVAQAFAAANRIQDMRPRDEVGSGETSLDLSSSDGEEKGLRGVKIELQNVHFKYPTRNVPVLNGLNMTVSFGAENL